MIFYDFKVVLNQEECFQRLQLAFGDESPCRASIFSWFKEFCSGNNSLQDKEHAGRPWPAVIPDNVSAIGKMLMDGNCCTYQMIQKELNLGSTAIYKIIHEELHIKKVVCLWVPHNLSTKKRNVLELVKNPLNCQMMVATASFLKLQWMMKRAFRFLTIQHIKKAKSTGLIESIKLEGQKTATANWYPTQCLPENLQEVNVRAVMLHHNSASSHTSGLTEMSFLSKNKLKLFKKGKSYLEIAKIVGRSQSCVQKIIGRFKSDGLIENKSGRGRKSILSDVAKRKVLKDIKIDPKLSVVKLAAETSRIIGRCVSAETVRNVIRHAGYSSRVARKKPFISLQNQKKRLEFAKTHQLKTDNFWKKVILSDESKFNIFGSKGRRTVWRKPNTALDPKNLRPTVKHGGGSVMVWGCMASNGVGNLVFIDGIMDFKLYIDKLNSNLKVKKNWV
ncbi:transposable element Tc1 transposase [Trichonephila clavipes]|nr:transposable element Tc1 transposase [Trichonephila clavipes]